MHTLIKLLTIGFVLIPPGIAAAQNNFSGTVRGHAATTIDYSDGSTSRLYIVGMKVRLMRQDAFGDSIIAETVTTEGGDFELTFGTSDGAASWDLYLRFVAENADGSVRVRRRLLFSKETREEDVHDDDLNGVLPNVPLDEDVGDVLLDANETRPQLLHWANRARSFVDSEMGPGVFPAGNDGTLDILRSPLGSSQTFFFPGGLQTQLAMYLAELNAVVGSNAVVMLLPGIAQVIAAIGVPVNVAILGYINQQFSDRDTIYIDDSNQHDENTAFHEFGHFLMWHLQAESWLNPLEASFAIHAITLNAANSSLAWTEGFANGFSMMVDTWSRADDGEFGIYGDPNPATTPARTYEDRGQYPIETQLSCTGVAVCTTQGVTHGYVSEWTIGTTLYDLWDGPDRFDPADPASQWDDRAAGVWVDDLQLSLAQILQPLLNNQGTGGFHCPAADIVCQALLQVGAEPDQEQYLLDNFIDYHAALIALEAPRTMLISDVFHQNAVLNLTAAAASSPVTQDLLNTDALSFVRTISYPVFDINNGFVSTTAMNSETFTVSVSELTESNDSFNYGSDGAGATSGVLSDDLTIGGTATGGSATLFVNGNGLYGWQSAANIYGSPIGSTLIVEPSFEVEVTDGVTIDVHDGGQLTLGNAQAMHTAEMLFQAGSTLVLGAGMSGNVLEQEAIPDGAMTALGPKVSKGKLFLHSNSRLVIERGAKLVIERGAEITLATNAQLVIRGDLEIRDDATLWYNAWQGGRIVFDLPNENGEPNFTMTASARLLINEVTFEIAADSYVRPTDIFGPEITIEHGATGMLGRDAYIDASRANFELEDSTIEGDTASPHAGIILRGHSHTIADSTIRGGAPGIHDSAVTGSAGLVMSGMTFENCETSIEVRDLPVTPG